MCLFLKKKSYEKRLCDDNFKLLHFNGDKSSAISSFYV